MKFEPVVLPPWEPYTPKLSEAAIAAGIRLAPPGSPTTLDYTDWHLAAEQTLLHPAGQILRQTTLDLRELLLEQLVVHPGRALKLMQPLLQRINPVGQNAVKRVDTIRNLLVRGRNHIFPFSARGATRDAADANPSASGSCRVGTPSDTSESGVPEGTSANGEHVDGHGDEAAS